MTLDKGRRRFVGNALCGAAATILPTTSFGQGSTQKTFDVKIINSAGTPELAFERFERYLDEMGVNATTINVADGAKIIAGVVSNNADMCMKSGFGQVPPAVEGGAAMKVIAGAIMLTPQGVLTNHDNIRTIADLKGKKVGVGPLGALEHQLMVAVLLKHGVDPKDVTFANVGNTTSIFRAVVAGVIDAGPVNVDVYERLPANHRIISSFWIDLKEFPNQGSYASDLAITTKREAIVRTLAAYRKM